MRTHAVIASVALLAALVALPVVARADDDMRAMIRDEIKAYESEKKTDDNSIKAKWSNGLSFETADKRTKLKIGGRIHIDAWYVNDEDMIGINGYNGAEVESGVEFRRARLYASGVIAKHGEFKMEVDFQDPNDPEFRSVYVGVVDLHECLGCAFPDLRVGHFKAPMGLEELTSANYDTFIEQSAATNTFAPSYHAGFMFHDSLRGGQLNYGIGGFLSKALQDDGEEFFKKGWALVGRVAWTPWFDCDCDCRLLHVGVGALYADDQPQTGDDRPRFRARPYTHLTGTRFVDSGRLSNVDSYLTVNGEVALVYGPWSVQGEYFMTSVSAPALGDPTFSGYYVQASYWLTGECRAYKHGVFDRVKPCCNFLDEDCCCKGAWELAARYDFIDLNDGTILGGEQGTITVGVNWHLSPNMRIMLNGFLVDVTGGPVLGAANSQSLWGIGSRFQVDF